MFIHQSNSEKFTIAETRANCDPVMQINEPQEDAKGTDSPREIKQRNSAQAAKKKETSGNHRAKTKDNITDFESSVHPALASRGFASHVFLVINMPKSYCEPLCKRIWSLFKLKPSLLLFSKKLQN